LRDAGFAHIYGAMSRPDPPATRLTPDLCVIGAGAGGLSVAAGAARLGASVVLIEGARMGGECLNAGCVPSKALLAAARQAWGGGPLARSPSPTDYAAAMAHVARSIAALAPHDSEERFRNLGCTVIRDWATFVSPTELRAGDILVAARRFVIATGSAPRIPDLPGLAGVPCLTTETLFGLTERPGHLLIVGGGATGLEIAQAHRRLGSAVTVLEAGRALSGEDPEAVAVVLAALRGEGVAIHENTAAARVEGAEGRIEVTAADGRGFKATHLLLATGRTPSVGRLNLAAAGLPDAGPIRTDARLRTANPRIFAIGDVTGSAFAHAAGHHAAIVLRQALFRLPARLDATPMPRVTFTDPELAQVGLTEAEARARHGSRLAVTTAPFAENDRAVAEARPEGFCKLMIVGGRAVGATLVGADAGDSAAMWTLAIARRTRISAIAGLILPYPTRAEVGKRAAGAYYSIRLFGSPWVGRAVRLIRRLSP
jgi:pyruvate/2-oxoglutarate dehydrogenase complex dihydrolipoamide dehydrogenase (E3) component